MAEQKEEFALTCDVCGENDFEQRAGYYFCKECGTQKEQVVEVECDTESHTPGKILNIKKIKTVAEEKPKLTSWECYNYILHGFVEELITIGAKEELKLMTLQLWANYLNRMEVAFFNKKHADLPKLGARFLKHDAKTIYNVMQSGREKRKRSRSITSGETSIRKLNRSKRKLDETTYSALSTSISSQDKSSSAMTSSSGTTVRAIALQFSSHARKTYKKTMAIKHLEKHAIDVEGKMKCHNLCSTVKSFNRNDHAVRTLNLKLIYALLAIALNLIEDDIQLCDLVRFICEGHLGTKNIANYFPANIMPYYKQMLQEIQFTFYADKFTAKALRDHVTIVSRCLKIREFKTPDIFKLACRYIIEMNLPEELTLYIERLINLLPPKMKYHGYNTYLDYEARAMAYIIYLLKLIFGLDGHKEQIISNSAKEINKKILELNEKSDAVGAPKQQLLFVWSEWTEYVEMRKVFVSKFNNSFAERFKEFEDVKRVYGDLYNEQLYQREQDEILEVNNKITNMRVSNMQKTFENYLEKNNLKIKDEENLTFQFSYTPSHTYFKRIQLYFANKNENDKETFQIPEFMSVDHQQRQLNSYLNCRTLREYFGKHNYKLKVVPIACTEKSEYVGVFNCRQPESLTKSKIKPNFEITEEEWKNQIENQKVREPLELKPELDLYSRRYLKNIQSKRNKAKVIELEETRWVLDAQQLPAQDATQVAPIDVSRTNDEPMEVEEEVEIKTENQHDDSDKLDVTSEMLSLASCHLFRENDMEPLKNIVLNGPRRNIEVFGLFDELSDEDEEQFEAEQKLKEKLQIKKELLEQRQIQMLKKQKKKKTKQQIQRKDKDKDKKKVQEHKADEKNNEQVIKDEEIDDNIEKEVKKEWNEYDDNISDANDHNNLNDGDNEDEFLPIEQSILTFHTTNMDCWTLAGTMNRMTEIQKKTLSDKLPRIFFWLLEICAQTLGIEWNILYEQLLIIEMMFHYGIQNLDNFDGCIRYVYDNRIKDLNFLTNSMRNKW